MIKHNFLLFLLFSVIKLSSQNFIWAKQFNCMGNNLPQAIHVDSAGNTYATGAFFNTIDVDLGAGIYNLSSAGIYDVFVSKTDAAGNFIWGKKFGGTTAEIGYSINTDQQGNCYVTGYFSGVCDFDPGVGVFNLTAVGQEDMFVCKLDANGNFVWAIAMGGPDPDYSNSIAIDNSGDIYITGQFYTTCDFDPSLAVLNLTSTGDKDIFICKISSAGTLVWVKQIGSTTGDIANSIVIKNNNLFVCGGYSNSADFDPGSGVFTMTPASPGNTDLFILNLNLNGAFFWAKQFSGSNGKDARCITKDVNGNLLIAGYFNGSADFDPGPSTFVLSATGNIDAFITKLDGNGNFIWAKQFGGSATDISQSITTDSQGNIYTTGNFDTTVDFDPGAGTFTLAVNGNADVFISKLDANGNFAWAKKIGSTGIDVGYSIKHDGFGNLYTLGIFRGSADFDPGSGVFNMNPTVASDIFLHKMCTRSPNAAVLNCSDSIICTNSLTHFTLSPIADVTYSLSFPTDWDTVSVNSVYNCTVGAQGNINTFATNACGTTLSAVTISVISCTGIEEFSTDDHFTIGPNPFSEQLLFSFDKKHATDFLIEIYDVSGKKIHSITTSEEKLYLDLKDISKGIYFAMVKFKNIIKTKKIIKQ